MGDIYKAVQEPLNRIVALKVLSPQLSRDEEFAKRFESRQSHLPSSAPEYCQHLRIREENGLQYFAMQYVDGMDLGGISQSKSSLSWR